MPVNKRQGGSQDAQAATEAIYEAWMQALLDDFGGEIPKLAKALHDILKTKEFRKPTDLKSLTNTIRHWYGSRRSAPSQDDTLTSTSLVELVRNLQITPPKSAKGASFEDALTELQLLKRKNKIAGKANAADAAKLLEQNLLTYPVVSVKNFSLDSIDQQSALFDNQVPEYVERDIDVEVLGRFDNSFVPYVILAGTPKAGKTRTALELLKKSKLKSRDLYWLSPLPGAAQMFIDTVSPSGKSSSVIFIDDLQNFDFDPVNGLTIARFKELAARGKVVATIHESSLSSFLNRSKQRAATSSHYGQNASGSAQKNDKANQNPVFEIEESLIYLERNLSQKEFDEMSPIAKKILNLHTLDGDFPLAATLASIDQLATKALNILAREDMSTAVLRAAIDSYMAFYGGATEEFILELSRRHYGLIHQNSRWRPEKAIDAFDELTEGVVAGSDKAILQMVKSDQTKFEILDGLWEHIRPDPDKWAPNRMLEILDESQANDLASISWDLGYTNQAKIILNTLVQADYEPALLNLADLLWAEGNLDESKENYERAAKAGNLSAQNRLGIIAEENENDIETANAWYLKAAESGFDWAQYNLADNLEDAGDATGAIEWYTKAADQGLAKAQNRLGVIAGGLGNAELAKSWYLKAADSGLDWAQLNLADNLRKSGDIQNAMGWYSKAAEQGLVQAQTQLGLIAEEVDGDLDLANAWYTKAAEAGYDWAQHNLADNLQKAGDIQAAIDWYTKAAEQGLVQSQNRLGLIAEQNQSDIALANFWYLKAAEAGFDWAQYNYADNLQKAGDIQGAIDWYTKAAEQGLPEAQNRLGLIAEQNQGDIALANAWYLKAAEAGFDWAQYNYADNLQKAGDIQGAINWATKAANQGLAEAQNRLGLIAEEVDGDLKLANAWYLKAAEAGLDCAQFNLADNLEESGDLDGAIAWYTKAAEQGLPQAQSWLGVLLERAGDLNVAIDWYTKAAESGLASAQYNLADTFEKMGDVQLAIHWYSKASEQGDADSKERLQSLAQTQISEMNSKHAISLGEMTGDSKQKQLDKVKGGKSPESAKRGDIPEPKKRSPHK